MTPEHATGWMAFISAVAHSPDAVLLIVVMFCCLLIYLLTRLSIDHKACNKQIGQLNDAVTILYAVIGTDPRFRGKLPPLDKVKTGNVDLNQMINATGGAPPTLNQKLGDE